MTHQHFKRNSIDEEGRIFLSNRGLSIPLAERMGVASQDGEISFPYFFNGQIVRVKYRNIADKKKMRFNSIPEEMKDSFKMPFWNQFNPSKNDYLIITEGEFDCIALMQLGASNCVSLPNGAGSVISTFKNHFSYLQEFDVIYIAFDMDEAGEKAVQEAKKLIPLKKFRRIVFPVKDANEWINANPYLENKDLEALMLNASKAYIEEIVNTADIPGEYLRPMEKGVSTGWKDLNRIMGGIRTKELTVISADTGVGKTTFCLNLLCNLGRTQNSAVWINSWEMDYRVIMRKIASVVLKNRFKVEAFTEKQKNDFEQWMKTANMYINPTRSRADIPTLYKQIELATKVYDVKYILLDHLDYISDTSQQRESHEKIKETLSSLHEMSMEFDVHILLIAHPKQIDDSSGKIHMGQLKGGSSIKQYADNVILLQSMSQADPSSQDNRMKVHVAKNRFFGNRGEVILRYLPESDSYVDNTITSLTISNDNQQENYDRHY